MLAKQLQEAAGNSTLPVYIEEVFSTYLYTGNGTSQTITNNIDLSTKGGLVWTKGRSNAYNHTLVDTVRGVSRSIVTDLTAAQDYTAGAYVTAFNTTGFSVGFGTGSNGSGATYAGWTFRKQPKFFDVQAATTNGSSSYGSTTPSMTIAHSLGAVPGCVIVKRTDNTGGWYVWHRSLPALSGLAQTATYIQLNTTGAAAIFGGNVNGTGGWIQATSTDIYLDAWFNTYEPGEFIVYVFAHDAGGFGLTGTDNVISCGSLNTGASGTSGRVNLGWEPQFVIIKRTNTTEGWMQFDNMRGLGVLYTANKLNPNTSGAEQGVGADECFIDSTGFTVGNVGNSQDFIYIAIRRGPMKVPTTGTSVFVPYAYTGNGSASRDYSAIGIVTDMNWTSCRSNNVSVSPLASTRLQGNTARLQISSTVAEATGTYGLTWNAYQNGVKGNSVYGGGDGWNTNAYTYIGWNFKRAPSFFDEVCYTGTGSARTINHNLGVAPEMIICKVRVSSGSWAVWHSGLTSIGYAIFFSSSAQSSQAGCWNSTLPTSTVFSVGNAGETNQSSETFVSYLFATCAGVSKVGSYTGTGTTLQVNCGFTAGARFVLIKRTDSTGDWYVWDSARGIVSGNDPYLLLNSTAAEVTSTDYIDTYSAGFEISSTAPAAINASGGTFIFLAIA